MCFFFHNAQPHRGLRLWDLLCDTKQFGDFGPRRDGRSALFHFSHFFEPSVFIFPSDLCLFGTGSGILQAEISLCPQAVAPHFPVSRS